MISAFFSKGLNGLLDYFSFLADGSAGIGIQNKKVRRLVHRSGKKYKQYEQENKNEQIVQAINERVFLAVKLFE